MGLKEARLVGVKKDMDGPKDHPENEEIQSTVLKNLIKIKQVDAGIRKKSSQRMGDEG